MTLEKAIEIGLAEGRILPGLLDKQENEEAINALLSVAQQWLILKQTAEEHLAKEPDSERAQVALELADLVINSVENGFPTEN